MYDFANRVLRVQEKDIFVFGRSIGCCVATYLAKHRNPGFCILMSPFKSLRQCAEGIVGKFLAGLLADRLDNGELLKYVRCPVFIVHGQKDELIHYSQSQLRICQRSLQHTVSAT